MLIGIHTSVARGYIAAVDYALSVDSECMQIFAKSPRQWLGPPTDRQDAARFREYRRELHFGPVFTHTAYLLNLSSIDAGLRTRSAEALADELARGGLLGVDGVVTHIGNDKGLDARLAALRVGESVCRAMELAEKRGPVPRLLIENTAGAGASFGAALEELALCIDATRIPAKRLGVCIDTCHAFAFGYDLRTEDACDSFIDELAAVIGIDRLGLVHANDCMFELGSKRDRHAWIGDGLIGSEGFRSLVCDKRLSGIPAVTEMPGEMPQKDAENMRRLHLLRARCS